MPTRPLAHRLLALVMGVLALQLTLWGASPSCATPPWSGRAMEHDGAHGVRHADLGDAARGTPDGVSSPAPGCQMPAAIGGCTTSICATVTAALTAPIVGASTMMVDAAATWPLSLHAPTRPLVPDVPPPKA